MKKIVASAGSLLDEVSGDPDHPLRQEFDRFVTGFIDRCAIRTIMPAAPSKLKRDLLARPELRGWPPAIWESLRDFLEQDARGAQFADPPASRQHVRRCRPPARADPQIRADMNEGFVVALSSFVESQKSGVSTFIADQVKRWDLAQLTRLIEVNIGRDLQYIRFNGMLIGGLAGLALYAVERVLLVN